MDLNVKLHGLKYNYEKFQGVKCKNPRLQQFSGFKGIIFLKTIS
jgi:hypothetical protein